MQRRMAAWFGVVAVAIVAAFAMPVRATTILASPDDFSGPTQLIDFETFPDGTTPPYSVPIIADQWIDQGVRISDSSPENGAQVASSTAGVQPHSGNRAVASATLLDGNPKDEPFGRVRFDFVLPGTTASAGVAEAGVWVQHGLTGFATVQFLDTGGDLLAEVQTGFGSVFAGLRAQEGIGSIEISGVMWLTADDLQYSTSPVPEPLSGVLVLLGMLGMARVRRASRARPS